MSSRASLRGTDQVGFQISEVIWLAKIGVRRTLVPTITGISSAALPSTITVRLKPGMLTRT